MIKRIFSFLLLLATTPVLFGAYSAQISLNKKDGIYKVGDTATCRLLLFKDKKPLKGTKARVIVKWELKTIRTEEFTTTGKPVEFSFTADKPGWVYFGFEVLGKNGKPLRGKGVCKHHRKPTIVSEIGALFDPEKMVSSVREPADFDEFWAKRRAELDATPLKPVIKELDSKTPGIRLFSFYMPVVRGINASGYFAYPANAKPGSLPGCIYFQSLTYSDVSPSVAVRNAKSGALAFAVTWHGFPGGKKKPYYTRVVRRYYGGGAKNIGDREKWVCSDMFFRVMRELDLLKSRPEWNGKTLVSIGGSLGGIQSAFAAAIDPQVTTAVVNVPSFCECNAYEVGRTAYGPYRRLGETAMRKDSRFAEAGFYYDMINWAKRINCEVFVCIGLADESTLPSNIHVFYNNIPKTAKKTITISPATGHYGTTKNVKGNKRVKELLSSAIVSEVPDKL